jgi:hypothetical protein
MSNNVKVTARNVTPREDLANLSHEIWAHWMTYMFSRCEETQGGTLIPFELEQRWKRQMQTDYADLSEKEKESDREQADKILRIILSYLLPSQ